MCDIASIASFLEQFAPPSLAAEWDNVGLLVGDRHREVERVMTCLTVTPTTAAEAIKGNAKLIVTHHPFPFRPIKQLTTATTVGRLALDLIAAGVAVYSPHTAFDSTENGINQRLAAGLQLHGVAPLVSTEAGQRIGRWGWLEEPVSFAELAQRTKEFLSIDHLQIVGDPAQTIRTVAVACGAACEYLETAREMGCDAMLLGEARFHICLDAEAAGMGLLLPGHYASERFALDCLAEVLSAEFPQLEIWASRCERDPVKWL